MKREKTKQKTDEHLSPEMVIEIKSVRPVWKGEGDYGGKNLRKRLVSLEWNRDGVKHSESHDDDDDDDDELVRERWDE